MGVRDVGSNIFLNMEPTRLGIFIDFKKMYADARRVISVLRIDMPSVSVNVAELSGGQRQGVAISRALARGRRIFIMDEPTAALGVEQQHKVNELISNLKAEGKTVLVISHNLEHVFTVADRLMVLRRGQARGHAPQDANDEGRDRRADHGRHQGRRGRVTGQP